MFLLYFIKYLPQFLHIKFKFTEVKLKIKLIYFNHNIKISKVLF